MNEFKIIGLVIRFALFKVLKTKKGFSLIGSVFSFFVLLVVITGAFYFLNRGTPDFKRDIERVDEKVATHEEKIGENKTSIINVEEKVRENTEFRERIQDGELRPEIEKMIKKSNSQIEKVIEKNKRALGIIQYQNSQILERIENVEKWKNEKENETIFF